MFFLDLLDNLPRLRLSDDHLQAIIWVMKECGTPDVPSFYALRKRQKLLTQKIENLKTRQHTSALGNHFYMNHPVDLLALVSTLLNCRHRACNHLHLQDWANPCVREFVEIYPEITTIVSESWQAGKYVSEVKAEQLTPMWADWKGSLSKHFYVNEITQLGGGEFVIPLRWVTFNKVEHAEVLYAVRDKVSVLR